MVIPHVHAYVNCDGMVIPHALSVLSEMVIPHIVYDGMVIPHIIKKILVEDLRWDGHSPRRDFVVYVHPVAVFVVP